MGNFSRDTFNPSKNYVGVRLQMGVPLVDSDWNELNDVIRHEFHNGFESLLGDGVIPGGINSSFGLLPYLGIATDSSSENEIILFGGIAFVQGRLVINEGIVTLYSEQPWTDSARAIRDAVPVIPPALPPRTGERTDLVYLDVWDREVNSLEDDEIVNKSIGIETCIRLKQEIAFRILTNTTQLPSQEETRRLLGVGNNHFFMSLALLKLKADQPISLSEIEDIRPLLYGTKGIRTISFAPIFYSREEEFLGRPSVPWRVLIDENDQIFSFAGAAGGATGFLPLNLPDGACIEEIKPIGFTDSFLTLTLCRSIHSSNGDPSTLEIIGEKRFGTGGAGTGEELSAIEITKDDRKNIVNNKKFRYYMKAQATPSGGSRNNIYNILVDYSY